MTEPLFATRRRLPGIGSHHSSLPRTDEWLTPPDLLAALGSFDAADAEALRRSGLAGAFVEAATLTGVK